MRSMSLSYRSGEEIRKGHRVLLHGEAAEIEALLDGQNNPAKWPAREYGRGVVILQPMGFGRLLLREADLDEYEDLEFVSRSVDSRSESG
jgi:hypothetical protein